MIVRADHVAGGAFVVFGLAIFALSGDLPFGALSMPGSGFMPKLVAGLLVVLGLALVARASESGPLSAIDWSDGKHASLVFLITALGVASYEHLGFILTMGLMLFGFLVVVERRNFAPAALYSIATTLIAYATFAIALKAPLPIGPFGF